MLPLTDALAVVALDRRAGRRPSVRPPPGRWLAVFAVALACAPASAAAPARLGDPVLNQIGSTTHKIAATATNPFAASHALALDSIAVTATVRSITGTPAFMVHLPGGSPEDR